MRRSDARVFQISESEEDRLNPKYGIDAGTKYGLPGLTCPKCGAHSGAGIYYPLVHFPELETIRQFKNPWPVSPERFEVLVALARPHFSRGALLDPGMRIGTLSGTCQGKISGFAWASPWLPLVSPEVLDQLRKAGAGELAAAPTDLRTRRGKQVDLLQLDILPGPLPADFDSARDLCSICGRYMHSVPDTISIKLSQIPPDTPLFRLRHLETVILCTQAFEEAVMKVQIPNIHFTEVTVVS